jgi:deoxyribodipyrimidine photo-lyase
VSRWWEVGEQPAHRRLAAFVAEHIASYDRDRDHPDIAGTSELSPHLAWGELSPAQVVHAAASAGHIAEPFIRQLAWREFAYHVLHHHPETVDTPLNAKFAGFPWAQEESLFAAWRAGATGYPLVDAGMRQLAATGWMHNRVRLVCGSFLTKHLLQPWQTGEAHFRERLVDYDVAANVFNWQWIAGCGADAAPYFRIFNPSLQGERFDQDGGYVRRWVPELARLESKWVHSPWRAPQAVLESAGVALGTSYPAPIVDHSEARARALAAYAAIAGPKSRL